MPALNFILPAANLVSSDDGRMATSPNDYQASHERFDQVMTRALLPSEPNDSPAPDQRSTTSPASDPRRQNTVSDPPPRRRIPTRNIGSEDAPVSGEAGNPSIQTKNSKAGPNISDPNSEKGKNDAASGSSDPKETKVILTGNLPGLMTQIAAMLPMVIPPLSAAAAQKAMTAEAETVPVIPASSMITATPGLDSIGIFPAGVPSKVSNREIPSNQAAAKLISSLQPVEQQKNAAKSDSAAAAKTNPVDVPIIALSASDLNDPSSSAEPMVHPPQADISTITNPSAKSAMSAPSASHGITAAKQYLPMKKTENLNKVAESAGKTEKVLPGNVDSALLENNLPVADLLTRISPRNGSATITIGPSTKVPDGIAGPVADTAVASSLVDLRSRALERTHDMVALQGMRLTDSKLDSLSVVIKPGAGLQLSLEMRQHGDTIDAQATLQRGDFGHLSQHWPELQQRLEQRGVRLAPLAGGENSTTDSGMNGFQQPKRDFTSHDPLAAGAFAEFALASSPIPATAASTKFTNARRGWETWA